MNSWNDNEWAGGDNKPCVLVTNERAWNSVAVAQPPMSDRENVLGWCMGDEMKNFGKDIMETHSSEHGFILYWPNCGMFWIKEATGWIKVSCMMGNVLFTVVWLFFFLFFFFGCSFKEKTKTRVIEVSHVLYYSSWCDLFFEVVCVKNVAVNQVIFYLVDSNWKVMRSQLSAIWL